MEVAQTPSLEQSQREPDLQSYPGLHQEPIAESNAEIVVDHESKPNENHSTELKALKQQKPKLKKPHQTEETVNNMKFKVQGTIEYLRAKGIYHTKQDVFEHFGVARTRGYEMLGNRDRRKRKPGDPETRGRPTKLSKESVNRMDEILQAWGIEGRAMTWKGLAVEAEVPNVSWRTIQRTMQKRGYRKCKACSKTYAAPDMADVSPNSVSNQEITYMLEDGPVPYSENLQFGPGPQHTLNIIRKPGEHHCGTATSNKIRPLLPYRLFLSRELGILQGVYLRNLCLQTRTNTVPIPTETRTLHIPHVSFS